MTLRVAIVGHGAIGHVVERALTGPRASGASAGSEQDRADILLVDRTRAPLKDEEPPVDAAVICVKTHGTAWAADIAKRVLKPDGYAVTIQNGLGNYETLRDAVGPARAAVGVIYVGARLDEQGELRATGAGRVELGAPNGTASADLDHLAALLENGGMTVTVVADPWPSVWRKVATNAAVNPTTALLGCVNSDLLRDGAAGRIADGLAREVARVATAAGVRMPEDDAVGWWREMAQLTGANRSSMLQDVEAKRPTEIDAICGAVYREARRRGMDAPLNQAMTLLVSALHPS